MSAPARPLFKSLMDRLVRRAKGWIFFELEIKHTLLILAGIFMTSLAIMLIYAIDMSQQIQSSGELISLAARQETLAQRHLREVLLASQGMTTDLHRTHSGLLESLAILTHGRKARMTEKEGVRRFLPEAPSEAIRSKLDEQEALLKSYLAAAAVFLAVLPTDPARPELMKSLLHKAEMLRIAADDTVKLYRLHFEQSVRTQIKWGSVMTINVILIGMVLFVHARRENRRQEKELQERKRTFWMLAQTATRLREAHSEIEAKIKLRTAELSMTNRDLETLLYVISHDLKEPLRAIENFSTLLVERYHGNLDDKAKKFLGHIVGGVERLYRLLDDILLLSRARKIGGRMEEIDGGPIVQEALARLRGRIEKSGALVNVEPGLPVVRVEKVWAVEAVYNLVSNALKFTRDGQVPDIEIGACSDEAGFVVRDRGPGVPADQTERIFQLFQRGVGREIEGTGAGLAIVRQVAQGHGGRAWVQPRPGGGSEFFVTFPVTEASSSPTRPSDGYPGDSLRS